MSGASLRTGEGTVLDGILARTRAHVETEKARRPLAELEQAARARPPARPFAAALSRPGRTNVIAEHKRRSPSRGAIREDLAPGEVARRYEAAGAVALSVLTDAPFFGGSLAHLDEARAEVALPVLRKDFVVDPWQVWEARAAGADAALLIVAALGERELRRLLSVAREAGLEVLVEVHDGDELQRALEAGARVVGVNNRNLKTLEVSLRTSLTLAPLIPDELVAVAESGIRTGTDLAMLREAGFDAFLVGEQLMAAEDPGQALALLLREAEGRP